MSTRSNIIIVTPDNNNIHQFYHHFDGYLSGVGEELRKYLVYSIGLCARVKKLSLYDILVEYISSDDDYEYECTMDLNASNKIHADVEYAYVIKDGELYYTDDYDIHNKVNTNRELINYICKDCNKLALDKPLHDNDE